MKNWQQKGEIWKLLLLSSFLSYSCHEQSAALSFTLLCFWQQKKIFFSFSLIQKSGEDICKHISSYISKFFPFLFIIFFMSIYIAIFNAIVVNRVHSSVCVNLQINNIKHEISWVSLCFSFFWVCCCCYCWRSSFYFRLLLFSS